MDFRRRFTLMASLGVTFALTLMMAQVDPFVGALVAMGCVVVNYWVALILFRRTLVDLGAASAEG